MRCRRCRKVIQEGSRYCNWCGIKQLLPPHAKLRANGEGTVYEARHGKWVADASVFVQGKRYRATKGGFKSREEALAALPEVHKRAVEKSETPDSATMQELYDMVTEKWFARISKSKAGAYRTAWKNMESIHNAKISTLRYADLQKLIDEREGGYYPKRDIKIVLDKIYERAMKMDYVQKDYSALIDLPPLKQSERTALTRRDVKKMWEDYNAGHKNTRYFLIMCYTGMRTGEMLTIQKQNVRLKEQYCTGGIKTAAGKARQIIFCDKIMPLVKEAYHENEKLLCGLSRDALYDEWHAMAERIGMSEDKTPYCCRHSAATLLAEEGVQPAIIQEIMGHTSYKLTAERYTHVSLDAKLKALNSLE